jgi:hypothetical protein
MTKIVVLLLVCVVISVGINAQSMGRTYKTALGVKVWDGAGVTLKSFVTPNNAFEVIGYLYRFGTRITGLYEIHGNFTGAPGLKWYVGPGAHLGFYSNKPYRSTTVAGIDGVLGLDLKVNKAPLNFSLDWQPSFEFTDARGFNGNWGGFAIRYTF